MFLLQEFIEKQETLQERKDRECQDMSLFHDLTKPSVCKILKSVMILDTFTSRELTNHSKCVLQQVSVILRVLKNNKMVKVHSYTKNGDVKVAIYTKTFKEIKFTIDGKEEKIFE